MKLNPFVSIYKSNGQICYYNSITMDTAYFDEGDNKNLERLKANKNFFVDNSFSEKEYYNSVINRIENDTSINCITLLLTNDCNFECKYCYIESLMNRVSKQYMSTRLIDRIANFLVRNNIRNGMIVFYGGEPFLNFRFIEKITPVLQMISKNFLYSVITNGSLLTEDNISFCKKNNINICVSLDGMEKENDKNRIYKNGKGTFKKVVKNLEICNKLGARFGLSITLGADALSYDFLKFIHKIGAKSVGINTLNINGNIDLPNKVRTDLFKNSIAFIQHMRTLGIMESKYYKLRGLSLLKKNFILRNCSAYGKQVVITPEGNIGPCQGLWPQFSNNENDLFFQLDLNSNLEDFYSTYSVWYSRLTINMGKCWKCPAIAICGGGCDRNSIIKHKDIWSPDEYFCEEMKMFLEWCIWDNFNTP